MLYHVVVDLQETHGCDFHLSSHLTVQSAYKRAARCDRTRVTPYVLTWNQVREWRQSGMRIKCWWNSMGCGDPKCEDCKGRYWE